MEAKELIQSVVEGKTPTEALGTHPKFDVQVKQFEAVVTARTFAHVALNLLKSKVGGRGPFREMVDRLGQAHAAIVSGRDDIFPFGVHNDLTDQELIVLRDINVAAVNLEKRLFREFKI